MGSCATTNIESKINEEIEHELKAQSKEDRLNVKSVLFGTRCCGKTTILKQLDYILNDGANINKISKDSINEIRKCCINNAITLCQIMYDDQNIKSLKELSIQNVQNLSKISDIISNIWRQQTAKIKYFCRYYHKIDRYSMHDNMDYFFDKIHDIMNIEYTPNKEDIIKYRTFPHSLTEIAINWPDYKTRFDHKFTFDLIETGNHHDCLFYVDYDALRVLSDVQYIIFVAALSDYCVYDEYAGNAMNGSLEYFDQMINYRYYKKYNLFLILNKLDIFKQCIKNGMSLKYWLGDDFDGDEYLNTSLLFVIPSFLREIECKIDSIIPDDIIEIIVQYLCLMDNDENQFEKYCNTAIEYIKQKYLTLDKNKYREIEVFLCNAMDTDQIVNIFQDIQKIIGWQSYQMTDIGPYLQIQNKGVNYH